MTYRLVVVSHGESETLASTIASFHELVAPAPADIRLIYDGPWEEAIEATHVMRGDGIIHCGDRQEGFCATVRRGWSAAASSGPEYVFWLEHDFVFTQPVDLRELAQVLDMEPWLAQMSLLRQPTSPEEVEAGGVIQRHGGSSFLAYVAPVEKEFERVMRAWLKHSIYFTTNPSLMRRQFMVDNPWPDKATECEGYFGIDLRERGYEFGIWGAGETWVRHIGARTGHGY